jgi:hypothetical protein
VETKFTGGLNMKKFVFLLVLFVSLLVVATSLAEEVINMSFGLKWTESFALPNELKFGITKEEVDSKNLENAEFYYDENGLLYSVAIPFQVKAYDLSNSDYEALENELTNQYGKPIKINLGYQSEAIIGEMQTYGESKHTDRMILEGEDKIVAVEHYLFGALDPNNRDHHDILVYTRYEGNQFDFLMYWHVRQSAINYSN